MDFFFWISWVFSDFLWMYSEFFHYLRIFKNLKISFWSPRFQLNAKYSPLALESNVEPKERDDALAISNLETIIHILKGNIGIGVLTLPMAIRNSGLIFGSLGLIFIAYLCVYCMMLLVNAAHRVRKEWNVVKVTIS